MLNIVEILEAELLNMAEGFIAMLPQMAIALAVIFVTWMIARFAASIADRLTARTTMRTSLKALVETLVKLGIWLVGLLIAATIVLPGL